MSDMGNYDDWKTTPPEFYGDVDEPDCDHEEYSLDILTGYAECQRCGERWHMSSDEIEADRRRQRDYDAYIARQEHREFWRQVTLPMRKLFGRLCGSSLPKPLLSDDEVPF